MTGTASTTPISILLTTFFQRRKRRAFRVPKNSLQVRGAVATLCFSSELINHPTSSIFETCHWSLWWVVKRVSQKKMQSHVEELILKAPTLTWWMIETLIIFPPQSINIDSCGLRLEGLLEKNTCLHKYKCQSHAKQQSKGRYYLKS